MIRHVRGKRRLCLTDSVEMPWGEYRGDGGGRRAWPAKAATHGACAKMAHTPDKSVCGSQPSDGVEADDGLLAQDRGRMPNAARHFDPVARSQHRQMPADDQAKSAG